MKKFVNCFSRIFHIKFI